MGGYAFYVWTAYAIALGVLLINVIAPIARNREVRRKLKRQARFEVREP